MSFEPLRRSRRWTALAAVLFLVAGLLGSGAATAQAAGTGHIKGKITVPSGVSITNIYVEASRSTPGSADGDWADAGEVLVKSDGTYDLGGLVTGSYRILVNDFGQKVIDEYYNNAYSLGTATAIAATSGKTTTVSTVALAGAAHIKGKVTNSAGKGIGLVHADVYAKTGTGTTATWKLAKSNFSGADGAYDVGGLKPGTYKLGFAPQGYDYLPEFFNNAQTLDTATTIALSAAQTVTGRNAILASASHIKGTLTTDRGTPDDGGATAWRKTTDSAGDHWVQVGSSGTDSNGGYDIGGLAPGPYRLSFYDRLGAYVTQFWNDAPTVEEAQDITVPSAAILTGKDAVLVHQAYLSGGVANQGNEYLAGITVTAYRQQGEAGEWSVVDTTTTSSRGDRVNPNFRFTLPPGTYRFGFADPAGIYLPEFYPNAASLESAHDVTLANGPTDDAKISAVLTSAGITGKVVNSLGEPVEQCAVEAYTSDQSLPNRIGHTDGNGVFGVYGLMPGSYNLAVSQDGSCNGAAGYYAGDGVTLSASEADSRPVAVVADETTALPGQLTYVGAPLVIRNLTAPSIFGTPLAGETLHGDGGAWLPSSYRTARTYQWLANGAVIADATDTTYKLTPAEVGKRIAFRVTGTRTGYEPLTVTSAATIPVVAPNVWATTRAVVVDSAGNGTVNVSCTKACSGWAQVWSDATGTKKSEARQFTLKAGTWMPLKFTSLPYVTSTTAKVRIYKTTPHEAPNPQFNNLTLTRKVVPPNVWATTAGITVTSAGNGTVNVSCTKACSGWAQVWSDATGTKKSEAKKFTLKAGTWMPLKFTSLPYVTSTTAKVRIYKTTPHEAPNPQFNNLRLTRK